MRDWAVRPVKVGCYSWAALSLIDSKTLYIQIQNSTSGYPVDDKSIEMVLFSE